jgi:Adenylate cyclase associated (CAP) C terminal
MAAAAPLWCQLRPLLMRITLARVLACSLCPCLDSGPAATSAAAGPPRLEFEQLRKKWVVENYAGDRGIVVEATSAKETVYIFGCRDSTIQAWCRLRCAGAGLIGDGASASCVSHWGVGVGVAAGQG